MNVELSLMMDLKSSARSVIIQSNLRGRMAVSFENRLLRWGSIGIETNMNGHEWTVHTLFNETWYSISRARWTPKNSPVIQMA